MKTSQALVLVVIAGTAGVSSAEISGSGHQVEGCTGEIRSLVWHDTNRNGVQDAGEVPLVNVELALELEDELQLGADTLRTDSSGHVRFYNLCLTDHLLRVSPGTLPPGMTPTAVNVGSEQRDVFDSDGSESFAPVHIELDDDHRVEETVDFGFAGTQCSASIGDRVWLDEDGNGVQDVFEPGLAGIELRLADGAGDLIAHATSDRSGLYRFAGLCAGEYAVALDNLPAEFAVSAAAQGKDAALDGQDATHSLLLNGRDDSIDFGLSRPGCTGVIAGVLFDDTNVNGAQDVAESGLTGVAVSATSATGYRQFALTGENGRFELRGLCAGSYSPEVDAGTLPADALPTTVPGLPQVVALGAGDAYVEIGDVGYSTQCSGRIGDRVWLDQDGNGQQDPGEVGLPDVAILLRDGMGNTRGERVTDGDGAYLFSTLCAGDYALQVDATSLPADFLPTAERAGDAATDSDGVAPVWRTLDSNLADDLTVDFGYLPPPTSALRLDSECHPLSLESAEFECKKPVSALSMIWRGEQIVRVVAFFGDDDEDVLTEVRDVAPGQRVEIDGYEDAPKDVLWRVFDAATGEHVGDSWFYMSCGDEDMDGPEDCGKPQGDGKDGEQCDDDCLNVWALDGVIDEERRLRCTSDDVQPNQQCEAQQDTLVYLQHELRNLGGSAADGIALVADHETTLDAEASEPLTLASGERVAFGFVAPVPASTEYTVSVHCEDGAAGCATTRSTSVNATPVPDCSVYGLSRVKKEDDKIKWRLTNSGRHDAVIQRVDVAWPDAHGDLKEIKRAGDKIVDQLTPPRNASFDEPSLNSDRNKRRIKRGKSEDLEFKFKEKSKHRVDSDYAITVHFEEGCVVTLTP